MRALIKRLSYAGFLCALGLCAAGAVDNPATPSGWPSFRGWFASGIAEGYRTPVQWNVGRAKYRVENADSGTGPLKSCCVRRQNIRHNGDKRRRKIRLKVGLYGDITPVEETAVYSWKVYCLDRKTGRIIWERTAHTGIPKIKRHPKSTHANPTPATDGKHVVAFFGSEGLYCYDLDGKLLWSKDLGVLDSGFYLMPSAQWGTGSSPVIYEDAVYLQCDVLKDSFVASVQSGRWKGDLADSPQRCPLLEHPHHPQNSRPALPDRKRLSGSRGV